MTQSLGNFLGDLETTVHLITSRNSLSGRDCTPSTFPLCPSVNFGFPILAHLLQGSKRAAHRMRETELKALGVVSPRPPTATLLCTPQVLPGYAFPQANCPQESVGFVLDLLMAILSRDLIFGSGDPKNLRALVCWSLGSAARQPVMERTVSHGAGFSPTSRPPVSGGGDGMETAWDGSWEDLAVSVIP